MIITVVTPTLNGAEFLQECIASVQRNRHPTYEIDHVIVDAGSTDATIDIAKANGLRVIQGKDAGIFDAINKGSFNSEGDLLGFLGSDDLMIEGALQAIATASREGGRGWVVGGIRWIDEGGASLGELAAPPFWMTARMHACLGWNPIMHMSTYFSRELFTRLGGFNIDYKDAGDYELFARALKQERYVRIAAPLTCFRRTGKNNSVVNSSRIGRETRQVLETFGPRSDWERLVWKHLLKGWFNLRNPGWTTRKMTHAIRTRFDPATHAYF